MGFGRRERFAEIQSRNSGYISLAAINPDPEVGIGVNRFRSPKYKAAGDFSTQAHRTKYVEEENRRRTAVFRDEFAISDSATSESGLIHWA
jgi:hypothetical protein